MKAYELTKIKGLRVVVGRGTMNVWDKLAEKYHEKTYYNPEGFAPNDYVSMVKRAELIVKDENFNSVILTNSVPLIDGIDLYSKKEGRSAHFFMADEEGNVEEITDNLDKIYSFYAKGVDMLEDLRYSLNEGDDKEDEDEDED